MINPVPNPSIPDDSPEQETLAGTPEIAKAEVSQSPDCLELDGSTLDCPKLIIALQAATTGLLWPSETDAPFKVFYWQLPPEQTLTPELLPPLTQHDADIPIQTVEPEKFFAPALVVQDWYGISERQTVERFQALITLLKAHLQELKVYCLGEVEMDIYIVGQATPGEWVGLATQVVET